MRGTNTGFIFAINSLVERDVEEELQSGDGGVERDRRSAMINQVQLEVTQILDRGGIGWSAQITCQLANCTHITGLRVGCELAQPHVLQHPLTQRGNLSRGIVHGSAPVAIRGGMPHLATYETEPQWSATPTPDKNHPYRASGLVRWPLADEVHAIDDCNLHVQNTGTNGAQTRCLRKSLFSKRFKLGIAERQNGRGRESFLVFGPSDEAISVAASRVHRDVR